MPTTTLAKTLQLYYSKLKRSFKTVHPFQQPPTIRSSFAVVETYPQRHLMFITSTSSASNFSSSSSSYDSDTETDPPDFATAFASQRFFFSSPGCSNSIVDSNRLISSGTALKCCQLAEAAEAESHDHLLMGGGINRLISSGAALKCCQLAATEAESNDHLLIGGGIPIQTYSPDPYIEFRQSMQEMVEATEILDVSSADNWDYLHELLLCYLALNQKDTHRFIVDVFTDLLMSLMTTPTTSTLTPSSSSSSVDARLHHGGCVS